MPRFSRGNAQCRVYTFKEGLLSAVAHDLELDVGTFEIEVADDRAAVTATFDPRSIRVLHAMSDGRPNPGGLGAKDMDKIAATIVSDVIPVKKHPTIRFASTELTTVDGGWRVRGTLELAGRSRELTVVVRDEGEAAVAEVTLHQPDFGIKPYSAMLGTLKIKPDVKVTIRIPLA
jgi:polyisoprenoid-binding protein YceI